MTKAQLYRHLQKRLWFLKCLTVDEFTIIAPGTKRRS